MIETKDYIRDVLKGAKSPALLCSFGKESLILLKLVREIKPDTSIFWFGDKLSLFAESIIRDNDLQVFSYAPADRYLVPNNDGYSLIDEYSLGQVNVPLISDLEESDLCELELLPTIRTPIFNYRADVTLWGYRAADRHSLVQTVFPQKFPLGGTIMDAPLYNWNEQDVYSAIEELRIPYEPQNDRVQVCSACLDEINATIDKQASLHAFKERFSFGH